MRVRFTPRANRDLQEIALYIGSDNPVRAATFTEELVRASMSLGEQPERYPLVERYSRKGVRRLPFGNYSIFYTVHSDVVTIIRVARSARDMDRLLN